MKKTIKTLLIIMLSSLASCSTEDISEEKKDELKITSREIDTDEEGPDVTRGNEYKVKAIFSRTNNEGSVTIENFLNNTVNYGEAEFSSATFQFKYNPTTNTYTFFSSTAKIYNFPSTTYSSYLFKIDSKDVKHIKSDDSLFFQIYYTKQTTWYFDHMGNRLDTPAKQSIPHYYAFSIYKRDFEIID